jgi:hypothetical protein
MQSKPGDLVLIHHRNEPVVYARIEEIIADVKPDWWQVRLILLQVPAREVTWILRDEYIDGEKFTMGGEPVILQPVPPPGLGSYAQAIEDVQSNPPGSDPEKEDAPGVDGEKVVSLNSHRRKGSNHNGRK